MLARMADRGETRTAVRYESRTQADRGGNFFRRRRTITCCNGLEFRPNQEMVQNETMTVTMTNIGAAVITTLALDKIAPDQLRDMVRGRSNHTAGMFRVTQPDGSPEKFRVRLTHRVQTSFPRPQ